MATEPSTGSELDNDLSSSSDCKTERSSGSSSSQKSPAAGVDPKVCGVCGDKALGNNFNAITCESCKAFFRRNALRTKEFVCPFSNSCKVDAITRRFCQRCRLKKCFDIGMKKEWIMTDEEKKIKKQKIEQNRKKRSSLENSGTGGEASPGDAGDGDSEDCPPAAKRPHVSTESPIMQRLTAPIISGLASGVITNGGDVGASCSSGGEDAPKVEDDDDKDSVDHVVKTSKQPMGLHSQNHGTHSEKSNPAVPLPLKGGKGRSNSVISIQVDTPSPTSTATAPASPSSRQHSSTPATTDPNSAHVHVHHQHYVEHVRPQESIPHFQHSQHSHPQQQTSPSLSSWMEGGDSSNSSLSPPSTHLHSQQPHQHHQPPPLVKYPPNKRPRMYEYQDEHVVEEHPAPNNQTTPLLSSLIQPSYPESSPDHASPPPATPLVPSVDSHSNGDDTEIHQQRHVVSYHPSSSAAGNASPHPVLRHHHHLEQHQLHQDYHEEYERSPPPSSSHSPPPGMSVSQNGFHHHHYSPPSSSYHSTDSDTHCHHHHHYLDSRQLQPGQNHQLSMRMQSLNTMDSILSIAIAAEFNSFGMLGGNIPTSKDLNKAEQAKLNELLVASQALHAPVDAERPIPKESDSSDSLLNVINLTEIAIRRLIKMSKKISGFKNMCQEDQIALLKGGCTEMMILRSAVTYDPDRDSWHIPHSNPGYNINLGVLKEARGNLYEEHQRFNKSFRSLWRKDENIMIILCAITLFTPERHNVIHRDVVKLEQDSYYYLLKRYLESIMNGCEAKSNYLQLIRKIAELRALNSSHVRVFLEMNPKEVEPLLIEIFDLK